MVYVSIVRVDLPFCSIMSIVNLKARVYHTVNFKNEMSTMLLYKLVQSLESATYQLLIAYMQTPPLNTHAGVSRGAIG